MTAFNGFPEGKVRLTPIPAQFFSELLPAIDHLGELKVTLYAIWKLDRMEGAFRTLVREDFSEDSRLMLGLGRSQEDAEAVLDDALEKAVLRGTLLRASISTQQGEETFYFLNSPKGRAAVEAIRLGRWRPSDEVRLPVELSMERPNIYRLYEDNIGPITPMLAESLRDAESTYPAQWIDEAVRISVENNIRNWRYIEAILRRWQEEGRDDQNRRYAEKDPRRYANWEGN